MQRSKRQHGKAPRIPRALLARCGAAAGILLLMALTVVASPTARAASQSPEGSYRRGSVELAPCAREQQPPGALCGAYDVWENREQRTGRRLTLDLVVVPALQHPPAPDPIVFLAGGPGQAATAMAGFMGSTPLRERRDLIFVDQRGTAGDHRLACNTDVEVSAQRLLEGIFADLEAIGACRAQLEERADLRWYATPSAMDDLHEIIDAMGYESINLSGGSYGTRAALVYMRRHPESVRTAVLDGPAPIAAKNPLFHAAAAQAALERTLEQCFTDPACAAAYPTLRRGFDALMDKLETEPVRVEIPDAPDGGSVEVVLDSNAVAEALRVFMYFMPDARSVPQRIQQAIDGDLVAFARIGVQANRGLWEALPLGMLLSVTCTEDVVRISEEEILEATTGTFLGDTRVRQQMAACALWPKGVLPVDFGDPVAAPTPTLVLSGTLDPVVGRRWGAETVQTLPAGLSVTLPGAHGIAGLPCAQAIIAEFLERASVRDLDLSCIDEVALPAFTQATHPRDDDRAAIRAILESNRQGHLTVDAERLLANSADSVVAVDQGAIAAASREQLLEGFTQYFRDASYSAWEDEQEPLIRVSRDGTMAWIVRKVRVRRQQTDASGVSREDAFVSAFTATYEKFDGRWLMTSVTSTFEPEHTRTEEILAGIRSTLGGDQAIDAVAAVGASAQAEGPPGRYRVDVLSHRNGSARIDFHDPELSAGIEAEPGSRWVLDAGQLRPMEPNFETFVRGHELHMLVLAPQTRLDGLAFTGRVEFEGRAALRLTGMDVLESPVDLFYSADGLLPLGMRVHDHERPERPPVTTTFDDWRAVHGLRLFHGATFTQGNEVFLYQYDRLEIMRELDGHAFAPPAER